MTTTQPVQIPVFRVKPHNRTNEMTIKYVGHITENDRLGDETVELDRPIHPDHEIFGRHSIPINRVGEYSMVGRIYRCNVVGDHLIRDSVYPYMYLDISYDRTMVSGSLLQVVLSFVLGPEEKKKIDKPNQYIDHRFSGQWVIRVDGDAELAQNYQQMLRQTLESQNIEQTIIDQLLESYQKLMNGQEYKFDTKEQARDYLVELCQSHMMYDLLCVAMRCREMNRRNRSNVDEDSQYTVPQNVTRMEELERILMEADEVLLD